MRDIVKNIGNGVEEISTETHVVAGIDKGGWIGAEEVSKKAGWISGVGSL